MTTDIHNLGKFTSLADVWAKYPNGAYTGDYVFINGVRYYWDKYEVQWLTRVDTIDLNIEVFDISTYDFVNYDWREALPDGKYSVICDDKIIGTLLKAKEGFVLEGFLTLYQGEKQTVRHGDHKIDKSEVVKDITEKTYVYNAEDDTFFFSDGHISNESLLSMINLNKKTQESFNKSITEKLVQTNTDVANNATEISGIKDKVGEPEDEPSQTGSIYARITQNQDDIASNAQSITRLEENLADRTEEIKEIKDNISSHADDINSLTNEVDNIKQARGEADGYASLDSDGKVPIDELPVANYNTPGILGRGKEGRIRRNYVGELLMELTEKSDANDVARAFTPKGETEPRPMQIGDYISNYGDKYPRNLITIGTGLDKTQTAEGGRLFYFADGNEIYKMIVDTTRWELYTPITAVDKRRIYNPSLMHLTEKSTAEKVQSALTPIGETQPVLPKAGDGVMDTNESVSIINKVTEGRENSCYIQIINAEMMFLICISEDMTKVLDYDQQDQIYSKRVTNLFNELNSEIKGLDTGVSSNKADIDTLKTTVADHETGLGTLADQIQNVGENSLSKAEASVMNEKIMTNADHIVALGDEVNSLGKDILNVKNIAEENSETLDIVAQKLDTDVVSNLTTARDGGNIFLKQTKRNIKTGKEATSTIYLAAATSSNAGVMTATDKRKLDALADAIADSKPLLGEGLTYDEDGAITLDIPEGYKIALVRDTGDGEADYYYGYGYGYGVPMIGSLDDPTLIDETETETDED